MLFDIVLANDIYFSAESLHLVDRPSTDHGLELDVPPRQSNVVPEDLVGCHSDFTSGHLQRIVVGGQTPTVVDLVPALRT